MIRKLIHAKCPHCKSVFNSSLNWHMGISLLHGEYSSNDTKVKCNDCGEYFMVSVCDTRRYTGKKIKGVK